MTGPPARPRACLFRLLTVLCLAAGLEEECLEPNRHVLSKS